MYRFALSSFCLLAALCFVALPQASAESLDPKKWCAEVADALASQNVDAIPAMTIKASRGEMAEANAAGFLMIRPVTEAGKLRLSAFLTEKNYNDALYKVWHLLMFGTTPLYVRCTFMKDDLGWTLYNLSLDTEEDNVDLP